MTRGRRREHYQWNVDIWGVEGVAAEAELLGVMVTFLKRIGLGPEDVGIKVLHLSLFLPRVPRRLRIPHRPINTFWKKSAVLAILWSPGHGVTL